MRAFISKRNVVVCSIAMLFAIAAFAQKSRPTAVASKDVPQDALAIEIAGKLVKYGYHTKTALPLIQAVEIFKRLNVCEESPEGPKVESNRDAVSDTIKTELVSFDEKQLLADAIKYADGNNTLLSLIKETEKSTRGATPKRKEIKSRVIGNDVWKITFRGGELAQVTVIGDGDTDLDLYVYDENGNLIDSDEDPGDNCSCTFIPIRTESFSIKIVNRGSIYNNYVLITN